MEEEEGALVQVLAPPGLLLLVAAVIEVAALPVLVVLAPEGDICDIPVRDVVPTAPALATPPSLPTSPSSSASPSPSP
jgi:hypothetical protein